MGERAFLKVNYRIIYEWRDITPTDQIMMIFNNDSFVRKDKLFKMKNSVISNRLNILGINDKKCKKEFEEQCFTATKSELIKFRDLISSYDEMDEDEYIIYFSYSAYKEYYVKRCLIDKEDLSEDYKSKSEFFYKKFFEEKKDFPDTDYSVGYERKEQFLNFLYTLCMLADTKSYFKLDIRDQEAAGYYPDLINLINSDRQWYLEFRNNDYNYQTIILTEGSSDSRIIEMTMKRAFAEYRDLFCFQDFDRSGHNVPSGGASYTANYVKFLKSIGYNQKVIAVFDNDEEGSKQINHLKKIASKNKNFRAIRYPNRPFAENYRVEINGDKLDVNINGDGLFLELYIAENLNPNHMPKLYKTKDGHYKFKNKKEKDELKKEYNKWINNNSKTKILENNSGVVSIVQELLSEAES